MGETRLTIQHGNRVFEPPVEDGVKIEWERSGVPGKLTFTTVKVSMTEMSFQEGDPVCFYYDNKLIFMGYVFTKKRDKEHRIKVTCYDQIRYLKNKFTYVFENKTATQIIQALCKDFNLYTGEMDDTSYVIPAIAEENISALDIALDVIEETLLNTGDMFVLYDDAGELCLRNSANMISDTLIMQDTAENFDYSSSIDDETYNSVVLYYKEDDEIVQLYTAFSPSTMKQWGTLRYFEEVKTPTIGQNKATALLKLYNRKTRELKVTDAFGDTSIRGGTLIPVHLNLGDITACNYMLVEKVTHKFERDHYTMDLTLEGEWGDESNDIVSETIGVLPDGSTDLDAGSGGYNGANNGGGVVNGDVNVIGNYHNITINCNGVAAYAGKYTISYVKDGQAKSVAVDKATSYVVAVDPNSTVTFLVIPSTKGKYRITELNGAWTRSGTGFTIKSAQRDSSLRLTWYNEAAPESFCFNFYNSDYRDYVSYFTVTYTLNGKLITKSVNSSAYTDKADYGTTVTVNITWKNTWGRLVTTTSTGSWSVGGSVCSTTMTGYRALTVKATKAGFGGSQ